MRKGLVPRRGIEGHGEVPKRSHGERPKRDVTKCMKGWWLGFVKTCIHSPCGLGALGVGLSSRGIEFASIRDQ